MSFLWSSMVMRMVFSSQRVACCLVKLFVWKVVFRALLLGKTIANISSKGDSNHMLFHCPFARIYWFAGPLPILSHSLQKLIQENLHELSSATSDEDWTTIANVLWEIWRSRNNLVYGDKAPQLEVFTKYLRTI